MSSLQIFKKTVQFVYLPEKFSEKETHLNQVQTNVGMNILRAHINQMPERRNAEKRELHIIFVLSGKLLKDSRNTSETEC